VWLSDGRAAADALFETTIYDGSNVGDPPACRAPRRI
jgi:hypothetical protein